MDVISMFGLSWLELLVIAIIAIMVLKPSDYGQIKTTIHSIFKTIFKIKREVTSTLTEIKASMDLEELNQHLTEESQLRPDKKIVDDQGNEYDAFDLSDLLPEIKDEKQKKPKT